MSVQANILATDGWFIGEHKTLRFTVVDAAGAAVNITGWLIDFKISATNSGPRIFTKSVGSGITLTTPASGILDVTINTADTSGLAPGVYYYALRRTTASNETELSYGTAVLNDVYVDYSP
jgi:hypothetical protein